MNEWIRTDDNQAVKYHGDGMYSVVQVVPAGYEKCNMIFAVSNQLIDLNDYKSEEALDYIKPFGYDSFEELEEQYGDAADQIIVECIAETDWEAEGQIFDSEDEAIHYIEKEIIKQENFFGLN